MRVLGLFIVGMLVTGAAWAQAYPDKSRPLRVISSAGAGSTGDVMARVVARGISEVSGVNAIVDNRPGAEGVIAVQTAKNASPDGYTMLVSSSSTHVLNPHMIPKLPYDPIADFVLLTAFARLSLAVNVGPSVSFKTARELIEAARKNPGKYSFGSGTTTTRLAGELLQTLAGIKLLSVPFKSVAAAAIGLAGGQVDILIADPLTASPHYKAGRVRPLAVTGPARISALPNVPTMKEEGLPEYEVTAWYGTYFPAKTPPAIADAMREFVRKATKTQYMTETLNAFAFEPLDVSGKEFTAMLRADLDRWGKAIRAANLGPQ